jgi:hypothetical protein
MDASIRDEDTPSAAGPSWVRASLVVRGRLPRRNWRPCQPRLACLAGVTKRSLAQVLAEHEEQLRSTAWELLTNNQARVTFASVTLDAELLNFWRGDRILRIDHTTSDRASAGSSLTRFPRNDQPDSEEIIANYLASSLANNRTNE